MFLTYISLMTGDVEHLSCPYWPLYLEAEILIDEENRREGIKRIGQRPEKF